VAAALIFS